MSSFALMTNYEILDLFYSEFREKFEFDEVVFTQRYVVGNKRIRLHFCKMKKKIKMMGLLALIFCQSYRKNVRLVEIGHLFTFIVLNILFLSNFFRKKWRFRKNMIWLKSIFYPWIQICVFII